MSDELERLVQSARRHVSPPSPEQREGIKHAVLSGAAVGGGVSALTLLVTGLAVVALGVVGALRYADTATQPPQEQPRSTSEAAPLQADAPSEAATTSEPEARDVATRLDTPEAVVPPAPRVGAPTPARARATPTSPAGSIDDVQPSQLQLELTLIGEATDSLEAGHLEGANEALRRYDAEVSAGLLATEADVLKVLVLCGTGQLAEARALAAELQQQAAGNPALARLRGSCATP